MRKKIKVYLAMVAFAAGSFVLVKTSGCSMENVIEAIESHSPFNPSNNEPKYDGPIGEPSEERYFDIGEHIIHVRKNKVDENGNVLNQTLYITKSERSGYGVVDNCFTYDLDGTVSFDCYNLVPVIATADSEGKFTIFGAPTNELEQDSVLTR